MPRICPHCLIGKDDTEFYAGTSRCKLCKKEYARSYREKNRDHLLLVSKKYYEHNKENIRQKHREYYLKNRDRTRVMRKEYKSRYYRENKEKIQNRKKLYNQKNKDKVRSWCARYRKKNPDKIIELSREYYLQNKDKIISRNHARRRSLGSVSRDIYQYISWCKLQNCHYCGKPGGTHDHIIPISKGGMNTIDNIVPCCRKCNSSKGQRLAEDWNNLNG